MFSAESNQNHKLPFAKVKVASGGYLPSCEVNIHRQPPSNCFSMYKILIYNPNLYNPIRNTVIVSCNDYSIFGRKLRARFSEIYGKGYLEFEQPIRMRLQRYPLFQYTLKIIRVYHTGGSAKRLVSSEVITKFYSSPRKRRDKLALPKFNAQSFFYERH